MERSLEENSALWELFDVIAGLRDRRECALFFRDLCTYGELAALAERWNVVKLLSENHSYREINQKTGVSTATITRIAHWLHHGEGGYELALQRAEASSSSDSPPGKTSGASS